MYLVALTPGNVEIIFILFSSSFAEIGTYALAA
jgi:hypothetical protein